MRDLLRACCPPLLWSAGRRLRDAWRPPVAEWEYWPLGFDDPRAAGLGGWNVAEVAATEAAGWADFLAGLAAPGALGASHEARTTAGPDVGLHNTYMSFAYVLARAAAGRRALSLLDWGSGLPHYYQVAQALYPDWQFDYHLCDLPPIIAKARELAPELPGHDDAGEALAGHYDLVYASSSTQYAPAVWDLLDKLAAAGDWLFVTRIPVVFATAGYVLLQRAHKYGYNTEYLGWVLNRDEFVTRIEAAGMVLEREFLLDERPQVAAAPEPPVYRGFLFRREEG